MQKTQAIILSGGLGTRLRSVVKDLPKVLAQIQDRPFLDILLAQLAQADLFEKVILAVGYKSDAIIDYYSTRRDRYPFEICFSVEKQLLGTAGAIKQALSYVSASDVMALNGDSFVDVDLNWFYRCHLESEQAFSMVLVQVPDCSRYGSVDFDSEYKRVIGFSEKSAQKKSGFINGGIYMFKKQLFDHVAPNQVISLEKNLLPLFVKKGISGCPCDGKFIDIGTPESLVRAQSFFETYLNNNVFF